MKNFLFLILFFMFSCQQNIEDISRNDNSSLDSSVSLRNTNELYEVMATYTIANFDLYFDLYSSNSISGLGQMSESEFYDFVSTNFDISNLEIAINELYDLIHIYLESNSIDQLMDFISSINNDELWEAYILEHANDDGIPQNLRTLTGGLPCYKRYKQAMSSAVSSMQVCAGFAGASALGGAGLAALLAGLYCVTDMALEMNDAYANYELCLERYN